MEKHLHDDSNHDLPNVILGDSDHARLRTLATAALDRMPDTADELLTELDRAKVVADDAVPGDVVRMGSTVEYATDGEHKRVTVVFPAEADIAAGKISVLTPIGAALIGLPAGESMSWSARDGRNHELTIVAVEQPA